MNKKIFHTDIKLWGLLVFGGVAITGIAVTLFYNSGEIPTLLPSPAPVVEQQQKLDDTKATPQGIKNVTEANNKFTFDLYSKLKDEKGNIFFSPYSISSAFAMVHEGANGDTAKEIKSVFHFPDELQSSYAAIYNQLNKKNASVKLGIANALWIQKDYTLLNSYLDVISRFYGGKAANVDFIDETEKARQQINQWVEQKTNNKIKNLFPEGSLSNQTRLALTNAIYFKGDWLMRFDKEKTKEEDFYINSEKTIKAKMMSFEGEDFNYAETDNLQILELLYKGEEMSMLIILPKAKDGLKSLENSFTLEKFNEWKKLLVAKQQVDIFVPKFTFKKAYNNFIDILKGLGVVQAFNPGSADFSKIDGTKNLSIGTVVHQAFIDVNEEGTEAAAATGVGMNITSIPIIEKTPIFRVDHPFMFIIQEKKNENILFLGRVEDPTE